MLLAKAVALAHDIGRNPDAIGEGEHNRRSFETLRNELIGSPLNENEVVIIQYCALFHTGDEWRDTAIPRKPEITKKLAAILRIADSLGYGLAQKVEDVSITLEGDRIVCKVFARGPAELELRRARQKSDLFQDAYRRNIDIS